MILHSLVGADPPSCILLQLRKPFSLGPALSSHSLLLELGAVPHCYPPLWPTSEYLLLEFSPQLFSPLPSNLLSTVLYFQSLRGLQARLHLILRAMQNLGPREVREVKWPTQGPQPASDRASHRQSVSQRCSFIFHCLLVRIRHSSITRPSEH